MKLTKRILAMALALMMVLSLSVGAMAAGVPSHTITIKNTNEGYTYTAYQIFSGNLGSDGTLSNIQWGSGVNGDALLAELKTISAYSSCTNAKEVAAKLTAYNDMDDPNAIAFAEIVKKHVKTTAGVNSTWNSSAKQYEISGLEDGYYFVENTGIPTSGDNTTYSRYILEVVRNVTVGHKGDFPKVDKKILDPDPVVTNEASIGEAVNYQITGTLPSNIAEYDTYYYAFHDSLSKGLTYKPETLKVTVNGVDVTQYFYAENSVYNESTGTNIYVGIQDLLALELIKDTDGNQIVGDITANTKVVVTYAATVNENAVIAGEGNPNEVYLEYSNDPNNDGVGSTTPPSTPGEKPNPTTPTGKTPEDQVKTFVTKLTIQKVDGASKPLTGAEFTLTGDAVITNVVTRGVYEAVIDGTGTHWLLKDGTYTTQAPVFVDNPDTSVDERNFQHYADGRYTESNCAADFKLVTKTETIEKTETVAVKGFVDENGQLTFSGLGAGTYTITETVTPNGYNTIAPITFTISFDPDANPMFKSDKATVIVEATNTLTATITNVAGTTLPSTGGMGTTLFYIFGGLMFVGAAVLLVTKKRMAM